MHISLRFSSDTDERRRTLLFATFDAARTARTEVTTAALLDPAPNLQQRELRCGTGLFSVYDTYSTHIIFHRHAYHPFGFTITFHATAVPRGTIHVLMDRASAEPDQASPLLKLT